MNKVLELRDRMENIEFTHNYICGFYYEDMVWYYHTSELEPETLKLDVASSKNGGGTVLKYRPGKFKSELIKKYNCKPLISVVKFEEMFKNSKYNRGEIFEKLITEMYGQNWYKDNVPYDIGADLTVNGTAYSIKIEKAILTTEKFLERRGA